jgi:hypothetical protein
MHPAKIISTILGPIPRKYQQQTIIGPLNFEDKTDIIVHDHQWNPISCKVDAKLVSVKYLGIHLDLRNKTSVAHEKTLQDISNRLSHLLQQAGSQQTKLDYIHFKIFPIAMYTAVCSNWTLAEYRALDAPFTSAYRHILTIPPKAPERILYLPQDVGGIGLPCFSNKAQIMKWETFTRCLAVKGAPAASVNTFLARLPQPTLPGDGLLKTVTAYQKWPRERFTARSIIEWLAESKLRVCCRLDNNDEQREALMRNNISIINPAGHLRLHPSELYSDEDNNDLPPMQMMATDGSFIITPKDSSDILTSESDLRDTGKGAGGIVFLPHGFNRDSSPPDGIRITCDRPEPGMNAFTWELVTQLIGLHFAKHLPSPLVAISDCTGAIARTNRSLKTKNNQLASTRGGIFATGAHEFSHPSHPKYFIYTPAHPERSKERRENPTVRDKAIYMADAIAGRTKAVLGTHVLPMIRHELKLENLFNEIIPAGHWHIRTADDQNFPVMGELLLYQHRVQLNKYTTNRDTYHNHHYWSKTAFSFANKVHPLKNKSYWGATRRALILFDCLGHGRNRAKQFKPSSAEHAATAKCHLCGQQDSQRHCMLECPHHLFDTIRRSARIAQELIAVKLMQKHPSPCCKHFIQQMCLASWTDATHLERIWLGLWCPDTLKGLLLQSTTSALTMTERYDYIEIASKLTAPLINAYHQMVDINIQSQGNIHHSLDHAHTIPANNEQDASETDITTPLPPSATMLSAELRATMEAMHVQEPPTHTGSRLSNLDSVRSITSFSMSDAAFCLQGADGAF